jgi:hypothetical protein
LKECGFRVCEKLGKADPLYLRLTLLAWAICMRLGECSATINLTMEPNCVRRRKKREVLRHLSREKKSLQSKRESRQAKALLGMTN